MSWRRTLDVATPWAALPAVVARWVEWALNDLREQLSADPDLTDAERAALLAKVRPLIEARTRESIEAAWTDLQLGLQSNKPM